MSDKQAQRAGDNARQIQITGNVVIQGVSEERAKEIADRQATLAIEQQLAGEAQYEGLRRIREFDDMLIDRLLQSERLSVLREPAFQVLLRKAQVSAASSGQTSDYAMLTGLLDARAEKSERTLSAAISRAVEVVDLLDDEALTGLSIARAVHFTPQTGSLHDGLDTLDRMFAELLVCKLPDGDGWLDHLDTLDTIRISTRDVVTLRGLADLYSETMSGYAAVGVDAERDAELRSVLGELDCIMNSVPHELKAGFFRAPFVNGLAAQVSVTTATPDDASKRSRILSIILDDYGVKHRDASLVDPLAAEMDKRRSLQTVRAWWDSIPVAFNLTGVGRALANANIKRLDQAEIISGLG